METGTDSLETATRPEPASPPAGPGAVAPSELTEETVRAALEGVQDPELPVNIVDLGLVYEIQIEAGAVTVRLTHTAIGCPAIDMMREDVEAAVAALPGVRSVRVETVWDPPWTKQRLTPRGRALLRACGISI